MALKKLAKTSFFDEKLAIEIINKSIANGWKGLFELKPEKNEAANSENKINRQTPSTIVKNAIGWSRT